VCVKNTLSAFLFLWAGKGKKNKKKTTKNGRPVFQSPESPDRNSFVAIAVLHNARIVAAKRDGAVLVYLATGECVEAHRHSDLVACQAESTIITGHSSGAIRARDREGVTELFGHSGAVRSLCAHQGRWLFSGSDDCTVRLWDLHGGSAVRTFSGHTGAVLKVVAFSRNNSSQAASCAADMTFSRVGCGDRHFR